MKRKSPSARFFPQAFVVCFSSILACACASASVLTSNDSSPSIIWATPAGTNLLAGAVATPTPATVQSPEATATSWSTLTDGSIGVLNAGVLDKTTVVTPAAGNQIIYALDTSGAHSAGYNITSFDSYGLWGDAGRNNQKYTISYATASAPTTWIAIASVNNGTDSNSKSSHTRLTDTTGILASNVAFIKIYFDAGQQNNYTGFSEFILRDTPATSVTASECDTVNTWRLPTGTNLLAAATPTPATTPTATLSGGVYVGQWNTSASWSTLCDGSLGTPAPNSTTPDSTQMGTIVLSNNNSVVTYALDLSGAHSGGYNLTAFDSYTLWDDTGRDAQRYSISYSTVAAPATFTPIAMVDYNPSFGSSKTAHVRLTDATGHLALNAAAIRIKFENGQENSYAAYSELVLTDTPLTINTLNESNSTNVWTLPAGTNLLHAASPSSTAPPTHGADVTSTSWSTLTDGQLGIMAGNQAACVAPNYGQSVIFPLDMATNIKGYDLSSLDFYGAWGDSGRDDLNFAVSYSTWDSPTVFLPLANVGNHTNAPQSATHTRLTPVSGTLAGGVAALQFNFLGQENNWTGYREFIALGQAASLTTPITWTGNSGSGGNASWISGADNNWTPGNFDPTSPLNFTATGINRNISIAAPLAPFSMTIANSAGTPYVFSGAKISVSNGITSATATGAATFNGPVIAATGVTLSGSGSLTFNGDLESPGLILSGAGSISLNADNQDSGTSLFTGTASVSNGTLNIGNDLALSGASLAMTGGTVNFTTAAPSVIGLSGTAGTVNLGNTELMVGMNSLAGQADNFAGNIAQAAGSGGLNKEGVSSLTLSGLNTYTGVTHGVDGTLQLAQRQSLYGGNTGAWTPSNIVVDSDATFGLNVGGAGEFTDSDMNAMTLGGFAYGATLGLTTTGIPTATSTLSRTITEPVNLLKKGLAILKITGASTSLNTTMTAGTIQAANPGGVSLPGDVYMGSAVTSGDFVYLSMGADNQFGADSVLHLANLTYNNSNAWVQLRGTSQTIAGLEGATNAAFSIIQNDYSVAPDYVANPALPPATLTINTPEFSTHSFYGLIRDGVSGAPVSIIKNGLGTQEFYNNQATGLSYSGSTTVNAGTLRLRFNGGGSSFGSDITVNSAGTLAFLSNNGNPTFSHLISGAGKVLIQGNNFTILNNGGNSWSGGTTVDGGRLSLVGVNATGAGTGPGQTCVAGAMDPSNVIKLINGGVMPIDYYAALGQPSVLPQYAPSIYVSEGSQLSGGSSTVAFVSNITLDGGWISLASGNTTGGFNTNLALVGTLVVGGVSSLPSVISTGGTGANANASLGSLGLPGTIFQVADVTGDSNVDLTVSSILRDISTVASPLTKTGPGTMSLSGANTYTGDTTVLEGTLRVSGNSIADTNNLVIAGGMVDVVNGANEVVNSLYFGSTQQVAGTYGSSGSAATYQDDTRFSGTGIVTVAVGPVTDPYTLWSAVIPNPADRAPTADPDGDGFSNLQEYLFGTSPIANDGSLTTFQNTPAGLIVRWFERASGTYTLQESTTLADPWTTSTAVIIDAADQTTGRYSTDYTRKEATIPLDSPRKFVRVIASE